MSTSKTNLNSNKVYLIQGSMNHPHRRSFNQESDDNRLIELQKKLMEAWQQRKVEDYYQQIILNYLDKVSPNQVEYQIAKEIKATHQGQSFYFKLNHKLNQRQKAINNLQKLISQTKYQNKHQSMPSICQQIKRLRDSNLQCAQTIIQLHRHYGEKEDNLSPHEQQILMNLDEQNKFLKESFLKQYIFFQNGYDPFFLYHYDLRGKKRPASAHPDVDKLFNLNVSYACRIFKTKKQLLNIISSGKTNDKFSYEAPKKDNPRRPYRIMPNMDRLPSKYEFINSERENESRKTSVNFRGKPLSLQTAIQRDMLKNGSSPNNGENSSNFRKRKMHTIAPDSLDRQDVRLEQRLDSIDTPYKRPYKYTDEPEFQQKKKSRKRFSNPPIYFPDQNQNLYRLVPVESGSQRIKKKKSVNDYDQGESLLQSPNWKVKLDPIPNNQARKLQNIPQVRQKRKSPILQVKKKTQQPKSSPYSDVQDSEQQYGNKNMKQKQPAQQKMDRMKAKNQAEGGSKKQIKMRPGKYSCSELIKYLKTLKLKQEIKSSTIYSPKWEQTISKFQCYFCQFLQDGQPKAVALCMKMIQGSYLIKLWGPLKQCNLQASKFLFQKYVQYIQKQTKQQQIYFNGQQIPELAGLNFVKKRQNVFVRKRVLEPVTKKEADFQLFLSLKCSSIVFNQQNNKTNILYSQQIQSFSKEKTFIFPPFGLIQKKDINSQLLMLVKINQGLKDMKTLNGLLQDEDFDTYQEDSKLKITNINALRLSINTAFKSAFVAGQGFIRLNGIQIIKSQNQVLYKVPCLKNNMFVYFGKGFQNCTKFVKSTKKQGSKMSEFDVKMFNKELYGRLATQGDEGCYGNWQISLWWQDQLQGRVRHQMGNNQSFGPDPFFVCIQIEGELVYAFQVKKADFLL